jgi:hypothetical protein
MHTYTNIPKEAFQNNDTINVVHIYSTKELRKFYTKKFCCISFIRLLCIKYNFRLKIIHGNHRLYVILIWVTLFKKKIM